MDDGGDATLGNFDRAVKLWLEGAPRYHPTRGDKHRTQIGCIAGISVDLPPPGGSSSRPSGQDRSSGAILGEKAMRARLEWLDRGWGSIGGPLYDPHPALPARGRVGKSRQCLRQKAMRAMLEWLGSGGMVGPVSGLPSPLPSLQAQIAPLERFVPAGRLQAHQGGGAVRWAKLDRAPRVERNLPLDGGGRRGWGHKHQAPNKTTYPPYPRPQILAYPPLITPD